MVKKTASIEEVLAAYQMIASRFHQKVGTQEEAEPDPFESGSTSWEEIG
jgi:hypothetical protein